MKDIRALPTDRLGRVGKTEEGATFVQFVRLLPYTCDQVWAEITNADSLQAWFPCFRLEHRQGGEFQIWFGGECEGPAHVSGTVDVFDPPSCLQCGSMTWQLEEEDGACRLTFTDIVRLNQDHRGDFEITNSVLAGWHFYMDQLEASLDGTLDPEDTLEYDYSEVDIDGRAAG